MNRYTMDRYIRKQEQRTKTEDWQDEASYGNKAVTEEYWLQAQIRKLVNKQHRNELDYPLKRDISINRWLIQNKEALGWTSSEWNDMLEVDDE